jgi:integrase
MTTLKAALNLSWRDGKVASDTAWRRVQPFEGVDAARVGYLSVAEAKRLINAAGPDFRRMVKAALQTGGRWSQLAQLAVSDFQIDTKGNGTIQMRTRKGRGKEIVYHVVLTDEGVRFFKQACTGLDGDAVIFRRADGEPWRSSHQNRLMDDACRAAKVKPPIGFHGLRHTWASLAVMNGTPLLVVAKNLGHSDTRMVEKHYGHLAPSYVADAIRAGAPKFI